jgi:LmbE family N-acetylglucosaminyl deacetylase
MLEKKADVLVITPHPDDAEFGCAGSVAKMTEAGKRAIYIVCTNGDKGTEDINIHPDVLAKIREKEQLAAAHVLGVEKVIFLRMPDQNLEDTPEFRKILVRYIRVFRPDLVITTDPYRRYIWHRDHRIVGRVVLDAVFPYARDIWSYPEFADDGPPPHKVKEVWLWAPDEKDLNFRNDITDTYDLKVKALRCHKSQIKEPFEKEVGKWLFERAENMADGENFKLAEGFHREEIWW